MLSPFRPFSTSFPALSVLQPKSCLLGMTWGTQDRALWLLSLLLTSCVISGEKLNLFLSAGITGLRHPTRFIPVLGIKPRALCLLGTHPAN